MLNRPLGLSPKMLLAHPHLLPDEALSSWIVALARANRAKVHNLCRGIGGNLHTTWNRDVDRLAPPQLIDALSERTGISALQIERTTLRDLAVCINGFHHPNGTNPWLLHLGIWHRRRLRFGVQFCSLCLRSTGRPYVRRSWRLAFVTECETHHVLLRDRCPRCLAPYEYFRAELGRRSLTKGPPVSICSACGCNLAYLPVDRFEWPDWKISNAQRNFALMASWGTPALGGIAGGSMQEQLGTLRNVITVLASTGCGGELYDSIARRLWPEGYQPLSARGLPFERMEGADRHRLFGMAIWLLMEWPERFRAIVCQDQLPLHALTKDWRSVPAWYREQIDLLRHGRRQRKALR